VFNVDEWEVIGEYVHDSEGGRHQAFYSPKRDVTIDGIPIKEAERVQVEQSLKYSDEETLVLWEKAELKEVRSWSASTVAYSQFTFLLFCSLTLHSRRRISAHIWLGVNSSTKESRRRIEAFPFSGVLR
jgi:hypothetical protein